MRIQHNITAMNSYRNFSANTSNLSKNLEKLSSGYKINRAGDDAAGLAISEKMRAQITGLEGATKNAKDGISLIQTAEGALTEVHDMLNRMVTLAEQSANGTYQDDVDREQLNKEIGQLKEEIDRIADSTNFNGLKLLDGSLSEQGVDANLSMNLKVTDIDPTANVYQAANAWAVATQNLKGSGTAGNFSFSVSWKDDDGNQYSKEVTLKAMKGADINNSTSIDGEGYTATAVYLVGNSGAVYAASLSSGKLKLASAKDAVLSELNNDETFSKHFEADYSTSTAGGKLQFTAKTKGTAGAQITGLSILSGSDTTKGAGQIFVATAKNGSTVDGFTRSATGANGGQKLDLSRVQVLDATAAITASQAKSALFEVGGKKFVMISASGDEQFVKDVFASDVNVIALASQAAVAGSATNTAVFAGTSSNDNKAVAAQLRRVTGMNINESTDTAGNSIIVNSDDVKLSTQSTIEGKALRLQIGDTSDSFNQLSVEVGDMHVDALGLTDVSVLTQQSAADAVSVIKDAVNQVSDTRGSLGALQNRLEHTINNLGVQRENIQNAESNIRDTDVAEEMMTYTKNNILNQSAQAMLAQANQLPQGVLQLLG